MKTAIILVTFNAWKFTKKCLEILVQLPPEHFVIAIADNGSSDETLECLKSQFPQVHLFSKNKNLGFGAANNFAIEELKQSGEFFDTICLLNNDTFFAVEDFLSFINTFNNLHEKGESFVLAPSLKNPDGTMQHNYFRGYGPLGIGSISFFLNAFKNEKKAAKILEGEPQEFKELKIPHLLETSWASAVCWILPRTLWEETGGFDEKIFMYNEDADLALRLKKRGARFLLTENIFFTHFGGGSSKNNLTRALQHDVSQEYVLKKHFGLRGLILSKSFRLTRSFVRLLRAFPFIFFYSEKRAYFKTHLILFKETFLS